MSRKLPEELVPVLAKLGHHWPEADEDGLRRAACVWREFGAEAERLSRRGGDSAQRVTSENSGGSVDAFADHWRGFAGGGRGHLDDAQSAAELVGKAFDSAATATDHCKAGIIAALIEVAEELKAAEAAEAKAKEALGGGVLGTIAKAVTTAVVDVGEAVAVEAAKLRVGALLEELGHEMKHALQTALKEPAVTALERLGGADGAGNHGRSVSLRTMSGTDSGGQLTGALGGALGGGAAVAGVRTLSAELRPDGTVATDAHGRPLLVDQNGKHVAAPEGVTVKLDAHGQPVVGADGTAAVVDADGKPVVGLALGTNGKPLTDAEGQPMLVGADGKVGASGLTLDVGKDGKPVLGTDGKPMLIGTDGKPVAQADLRTDLRTDPTTGLPTDLQSDLKPGQHTVKLGADGRPLADVELKSGTGGLLPGAGGAGPGAGPGAGGFGPVAGAGGADPQADFGPQPDSSAGDGGRRDGLLSQAGGGGAHGGGHGGGGGGGEYRRPEPVQSYDNPGGYDSGPVDNPAPVHLGPVSVRTDSVGVAPQPTAPGAGAPDPWAGSGGSGDGQPGNSGGGGGGGGYRQVDPPIAGGGGLPGGGLPSGGGSVPSAPVGVGPVGGGPVGAGPVGGGPVAGTPVVGGPVPGSGAGGAGGVPVGPVAPGAPAAPAGPVGGQPGMPGAPGASGTPGTPGQTGVVGAIGTGIPAQDARQTVGAARPPAASPMATPGTGSGQAGAVPFRLYADVPDLRRRPDGFGYADGQHGTWSTPVEPGQVSAYLVVHSYGRTGVQPAAAERPQVRTIADSRPYGLPGGLGQVDPAHQREIERRVPRTPEGVLLPRPDPRVGDWAEALNGGGHREPGRSNNCVDLALSGLDTFAGNPTCGAPRLPDGPAGERGGRDRAERELGTHFRDLGSGDGAFAVLAEALMHSGPGAQAVLLTLDEYGRSHTWNAVAHGETVTFLDYQAGRQSSSPLYSADHGLWAIAVDVESRPIDLTGTQLTFPVPVSMPERAEKAERAARPAQPEEPEAPVAPEAPAPPRSRLTIHRTPAGTSTRSTRR